LGVIRIGNRCDFNANAVPADLQRVSIPQQFIKLTKYAKFDRCGASRVRGGSCSSREEVLKENIGNLQGRQ
jgi:hypothetical protein